MQRKDIEKSETRDRGKSPEFGRAKRVVFLSVVILKPFHQFLSREKYSAFDRTYL